MRDDDPESGDSATLPGYDDGYTAAGYSVPAAAEVERARVLVQAASVPRRRSRQWLGSRRRQAFAGVIVLGAIGYIAFQGLTSAAQYFLTTKQAVEQKSTLGTKPFRIEGTVAHDVRQVGQLIDFNIYADDVTVHIVSTGSPPQLFKAGIPVVLVGHWQGSYFASNEIMVKHTADYTEVHSGTKSTKS